MGNMVAETRPRGTAGEDQSLPSESAGAPSGSADPVAVVNIDAESEAFEEATERKPERQPDSESEVSKEAITRK